MKKLTILLIAVILYFASAANVISVEKPLEFDVQSVKTDDLRVKALENVLVSYNSPLAPYAKYYVKSADKYGMDWKLLPAIAGLESSFGKRQMPSSHNSYGWGGGHIYFDSVEDGIDTVLYALKTKYASRGATTVETIAPIYSESSTWAPRINMFMSKFEAEYARLNLTELDLTI